MSKPAIVIGKHYSTDRQKDVLLPYTNYIQPVPYLAKLDGERLQPGQSLILRGIITGKDTFTVSLTTGLKVEVDEDVDVLDDRLLSMRVDVEKRKIFFNACINNEWGKEGVIKHKWKVGDEFDLRIRCHEDEFEIFIDHKLAAQFAHYVPIDRITHIFVTGPIELYTSEWTGTYYQMPYAADIPGNLYTRRKLYVSGFVKKAAKQCVIDFLSGANIVLRMDKIICNTRVDDVWGQEHLIKPFVFRRSKTFDLLIYVEKDKFMVYNDDCLLGSFEHRMDPQLCEKIQISGDIVLQGVHLK